MPRLHQILPVHSSVSETTARALEEAKRGLANTAALNGFIKTYEPKDIEGDQLPGERKKVQYSAADVVALVAANLTRLLDVTAVKEYANTQATADVKIGDRVLVHNAPVSYLLFLAKQVAEMLAFVEKLPTLDPAVNWQDGDLPGHYKSEPVEQARTRKITDFVIAAPATDKHPAQVREVSKDELAGYWTTVQLSAALPAATAQGMKDRLVQLREAVLHAREQANSVEVGTQNEGAAIVDFVFNG